LIEYLEKLVEDGDYNAAIECAERLMLSGDNSAIELARIHCGLLISRYQTDQFYAASVSGQLALNLARELEEWDLLGRCCFWLGCTYHRLGNPQLAISTLLQYFNYKIYYSASASLEPLIWVNIGIFHTKMDDPTGAIGYLKRAVEAARARGDSYIHNASRHALVEAYVLKGDLRSVPRLMAESLHFLRHNEDKWFAADSYLWHMLIRAKYAVQRNLVDRAIAIATRALKGSENRNNQQFYLNMLLAGLFMKKGLINEAFGYSLSARICAIRGKRYDFESQAMDLIYQMTSETGLDSITVSSEFIFDEAHASLFSRSFAH